MRPRELVGAAGVLARTFGARGAARRASFELRKRRGRFAAGPAAVPESTSSAPMPPHWPFAPDAARVRRAGDRDAALARADRVAGGEYEAFRWAWTPLPEHAGAWSVHPRTGFTYPPDVPWWQVPHFDRSAGDIKDIWEPARFAWAYDLARGFMISGDERYPDRFWRAFESFVAGAPPFSGVQWSCGQETAIRAIAWLWAEGCLHDAPSSTRDRLGMLRTALAWSAERIDDAVDYALSQRNNHGISEAAGLVAIGARLAGAHPDAERWLERGAGLLGELVRDQIAPDGWYIQHSFNYARVALDQLVVSARAVAAAGRSLDGATSHRVQAAIALLATVIDPATGRPPLHGANDGAMVLPLSTRGYRDFVPSLTAAAATFGATLPAPIEPDAETLAWLGLTPPRTGPVAPEVSSGRSGWVVARTKGARIFARAGHYSSRPGHIDPLHVDVWIGGAAIATDAGTYRYAAPPPWDNGLAAFAVHNSLAIAGRPPARRGPRFLWYSWPGASIVEAVSLDSDRARVVLENESWADDGIRHRRSCHLNGGGVIVVDDVIVGGAVEESVELHWLLDAPADAVAIVGSAPIERDDAVGEEGDVSGWISEHYGQRRAITSVRVRARARGSLRLVSAFGDACVPAVMEASLRGDPVSSA